MRACTPLFRGHGAMGVSQAVRGLYVPGVVVMEVCSVRIMWRELRGAAAAAAALFILRAPAPAPMHACRLRLGCGIWVSDLEG
jgi:hypothetical protein